MTRRDDLRHRARLAAAFAGVACGQSPLDAPAEPDGADCTVEGSERFVPLVEGATWTIDANDLVSGAKDRRTQTVGALADIGGAKAGVMAFPVKTVKDDGEVTVWQEDSGAAVVRHLQEDRAGGKHKDDLYWPFKGRFDESPDRLVEGAAWTDSYEQSSTDLATEEVTMEDRQEAWKVERYGELVEVPAGEFCTVRVSRVRTTDGKVGSEKLYWFARGVGKVKERSGNDREELVAYDIPSP